MKRNLFNIGIGGFGSRLASEVTRKMTDNGDLATFIAVDTDFREIEEISCDYKLDLSIPEKFIDTLERLQSENVRIFSEDISSRGYVKTLPMDKGANSWRIKAMVSFTAYMSDVKNKEEFDEFLDGFSFNADDSYTFNIYSSLAGGTGSALFTPIALYIKKYLKEKGCRKLEFTYFGACPDIFTEGLTAELKVKAYANAYASLSELSSINDVALRKSQSKIKIGFENSSLGVLFNGEEKEFYNKEAMPFTKVYLFDRMPGVFSSDIHLNVISDYVSYLSLGLSANVNSKNCALVKAYSATEISLDTEDIIDYVAKFNIQKNINSEILKPYLDIERVESFQSLGAKKQFIVDESEEYAKKVKSYLENLDAGKDEKTACVLGRLEEDDRQLTIDDEYWISSYCEKISNAIEERLQNDEFNSIYSQLKNIEQENKSKKELIEELKEKTETLVKEINEFYFSSEKTAKSEDYKSLFLKGDEEFSLIVNVLKEDGKYIHPTLALIRLSLLYVSLKKRAKIYSKLKEEEIAKASEENLIPETLLLLDNPTLEAKGYGALPEDRFLRVIAKREKFIDIKKLSSKEKKAYIKAKKKYVLKNIEDEKLIYSDIKGILEAIISERKSYFINQLANIVSALLDEYRGAIKGLSLIRYRTESEVEYASHERINQGVYYGVATDEKSRKRAIKSYENEIKPYGHGKEDSDLGKRFLEFSLNNLSKEKTESLKPFENLVNILVDDRKENIKNSEYYKDLISKNVFSEIINENSSGEKSYLKTALMISPNLLTENPNEETQKKTLFISNETANYVLSLKDKLLLRANTPEEAVDEYLVSIGVYDVEIKVLDNLTNKKAYAVAERNGIKISSLSKMNGEKDISIYKNEYQKAIINAEKLETPMWNPHLFDIKGSIDL